MLSRMAYVQQSRISTLVMKEGVVGLSTPLGEEMSHIHVYKTVILMLSSLVAER